MDEKRNHILAVAQKIFARFGFRKTTVDEIAKASGIGKSTLYYYFKSKEEVFTAVIQRDGQVILQKLTEAINSSATPQEKLRNYMITQMRTVAEMSAHYEILKAEYLSFYPLADHIRKMFQQQEVEAVTAILQEGVQQDVFTIAEIPSTAKTLIAILQGIEEQFFFKENKSFNMEHELNILLNILLKGIERR
jgi:AcrR family transcriptional regulator